MNVTIFTDPRDTVPSDWGLPPGHTAFRPGQAEALAFSLQSGINMEEAPTGSGKTAMPAAAGALDRVVAMCRTMNLQEVNYEREYRFTPIYGKRNYRCIHPDAEDGATCQDCLFTRRGQNQGMHKCPYSYSCEYLMAKAAFNAAQRATCNYAYWMSSIAARRNVPPRMYLDECHQLIPLVLDWTGITVTNADRSEWGLPPFPRARPVLISNPAASILATSANKSPPEEIVDAWIEKAKIVLLIELSALQGSEVYRQEASDDDRKRAQKAERLFLKLEIIQSALRHGDDWFIESGQGVIERGGSSYPGLIARPLSPKAHFSRYFPVDEAMAGECSLNLMSATIGNFEVFAEQLGISEWVSTVVPSRFRPEQQPLFDIGAPSMGRGAKESAFEKQAELIAQAVLAAPRDWSGMIHVTRWSECANLAKRLARHGLAGRLYVPKPGPTRVQVAEWESWRDSHVGQLIITPSLREGYNGLDEKINVIAKCPFGNLGSRYARARLDASRRQYLQETAWELEQAKGRTRRGRDEDYDTETERKGLNILADGAARARGVLKYLSAACQESVVKGMP